MERGGKRRGDRKNRSNVSEVTRRRSCQVLGERCPHDECKAFLVGELDPINAGEFWHAAPKLGFSSPA